MEFMTFKTDDRINKPNKIQINTIEELLKLLENNDNFKGRYTIFDWTDTEIVIGYDKYDKAYFIEFVNDYRE